MVFLYFFFFFLLFLVRGSDSDGKWETPPNWPSPFSSSPALQVGVEGGLHGLLSAGENSVQCSLLPLQRALHSFLVYVENAVQCSPVGRGGEEMPLCHLITGALSLLVPFLCVLHMWMRAVHVDVNGE